MKKLAESFTEKGFNHKQVHRDGSFAIYCRWRDESPDHKHYEVIRIQSHNGYSLAGKDYPPSEFYPSSNSWGLNGFTCGTKEKAYERLDRMISESENKKKQA